MISNLPASLCWNTDDTITAADSIISNVIPIIDATLQNASEISKGRTLSLDNWHRVWGPAVIAGNGDPASFSIAKQPKVPVSSMTIFKDDNSNNYVVGIEATNPYSMFDWDVLDLNVGSTHPWFYDAPVSGQLSQGTWIGISGYLLQLKDREQNTTAIEFLDKIIQSGDAVNITVTGHSLGGALSPVFALYMHHEAEAIPNSKAEIYCMSTAGPTPGDTQFANYYDERLANNTIRLWNKLDVVPRAWVTSLLEEIKSSASGGLYHTTSNSVFFDSTYNCNKAKHPGEPVDFHGMKTPTSIDLIIQKFINTSENAGVTYGPVCGDGTTFTGIREDALYISVPDKSDDLDPVSVFGNDKLFMEQLGNQHVAAYALYYDIKEIHEYMRGQVQDNPYSAVNWKCRNNVTSTQANISNKDSTSQFMGLLYKYAWR